MSLDQLSESSPRYGLLIKKSSTPPVLDLEETFVVDTKEFPIFGGEAVFLDDYIVYDPGEEDSDIQLRTALSRGAIKMHYDDFTGYKKKGIKLYLDIMTESNKRMLDNGSLEKEKFVKWEEQKYYFAVMRYFQEKRNRLWKKKMVDLEYEYRHDCLVKCRRPNKVELTTKINLFKASMIVCERFVCLHTYGFPGKNYSTWEDDEPFSFTCPSFLYDKWLENNVNNTVEETITTKNGNDKNKKVVKEGDEKRKHWCSVSLPSLDKETKRVCLDDKESEGTLNKQDLTVTRGKMSIVKKKDKPKGNNENVDNDKSKKDHYKIWL